MTYFEFNLKKKKVVSRKKSLTLGFTGENLPNQKTSTGIDFDGKGTRSAMGFPAED